MNKVVDIIGNAYNIDVDKPHFGIEIEVENASTPDGLAASLWHVVSDGSLRNSGLEFLSQRPFTKEEAEAQVPAFYEWKRNMNYSTGVRTSTHVHVNVLGMGAKEIAAATIVYTLLEPILFRYCGRTREENIYCVPWYRATDELDIVKQLDRGLFNSGHMACKYSALYLEPITRFGTLEFRHAPVYDTAEQLLTWVDMCERVVYSGFDTIEEVLECFEELSADEFVKGILGDRLTRVLQGVCDASFEELMEQYDVLTTAEMALACTYKPTEWFIPNYNVEGEGTEGYHSVAMSRRRSMYELRSDDGEMDEDMEEYYDEEPEEDY